MVPNLKSKLKGALLAGVLVLAPLGVTVWVFRTLVGMADGALDLLPLWAHPETWLGFRVPGLGVLLTLGLVIAVGGAMQLWAGRTVVEFYESLLARVPVLSGIYGGVKQLTNTLLSPGGHNFRQVVLVEYPRRGLWCLAFVTNERQFIDTGDRVELISIFLPTTPNPTSGFYLLVPRGDVRKVDLTVDEAFKLIMSAGIVTPDSVRTARAQPAQLAASK